LDKLHETPAPSGGCGLSDGFAFAFGKNTRETVQSSVDMYIEHMPKVKSNAGTEQNQQVRLYDAHQAEFIAYSAEYEQKEEMG
jgi:hypothetical protein